MDLVGSEVIFIQSNKIMVTPGYFGIIFPKLAQIQQHYIQYFNVNLYFQNNVFTRDALATAACGMLEENRRYQVIYYQYLQILRVAVLVSYMKKRYQTIPSFCKLISCIKPLARFQLVTVCCSSQLPERILLMPTGTMFLHQPFGLQPAEDYACGIYQQPFMTQRT